MAFQTGFGLIKPLRPRAAFANRDKLLTGLGGPGTDVPLINSDVYYHEAHFPVSSARLLGTFKIDEPIYFKLALDHDTDVAIRTIGRNAKGLRTVSAVEEAEPSIVIVKGLAGGSGSGGALENQHVALLPRRAILNSELPFIQFRDEGDVTQKSQIRSRRTPTGAQNVVTDWNCSGDGRIYQVIYTAGSKDIQIIPGAWFDDLTVHPVPYWVEGTAHSFRGGQGVRIFGPTPGSAPTYTTVTGVNGNTITLADALTYSANPGAFAHDDTANLQAAIDNRGHIWIPEGRYWCRQRLIWPSTATGYNQQIIIEGDGEWRSVIVFNHDGNGLQLDGPLQTGNTNSGLYDAVIRNLGLWCVPDDSKEGIRATSKGHGLAFTATHRGDGTPGGGVEGVPGPSTGNVRVENVLLQGWGRFGLWSDNLQTAFLTNLKGYHCRSGAIAIVGNATRRGTSQQEDNSIEIVNSLVVYSGPQDFGGGAAAAKTLSGGSISVGAPRSLTVSGGLTAADVGCIVKLVNGPGVESTTHVTMIESVQSATACTISMPVWQSASGFQVIVYQTCVANVFLHNANNVRISGGTHQGNWVAFGGDAGGVRAEHLDALRIDGLWEEDAGGTLGAAIDLYDCRAVSIDSSHTGGSIQPLDLPPTPVGHSVGIRMTDCQGVKVRGTYLGQSGGGTAYQTHGNCQGVDFENCYGADWIAGLANTDVAGEPAIIGPGCHSLSFDNVQTSTLALWDEQWTNIVGNPNFLEGMVGWTTPVAGVVTQPNYPYEFLTARWDRYVVINTQALGPGVVDVLTQDIALPDSRQSGQWTLGWDHYIESRGAGGSTDNNTVVTIEVRTASAGYTVRSVTLTADPGYGLPVGRWMRLCIKTNLDGGATGRFFRIRFSNAGTANSPIFRVANLRLQPGISSTFDFDQPITQERGGPLYAPLYFKPLNPAQFPPPPPPAGAFSIVNIGGVPKIGKDGVYVDVGAGAALSGRQGFLPKFQITDGLGGLTALSDSSSLSESGSLLYEQAHDFVLDATRKIYLGGPTTPQGQAMYWDNSGTPPRLFIGTSTGLAEIIEFITGAQTPTGTGRFYIDGNWSRLTWNAQVDAVNSGADGAALYLQTQDTDNGVWVKMPAASDGDPFAAFVGANRVFAVDALGNAQIHSVPYLWPALPLPVIDATHTKKVLGYTDATLPVALAWLDPTGTSSGVTISGTANRVAKFNATGDNVKNSAIEDRTDTAAGGDGFIVSTCPNFMLLRPEVGLDLSSDLYLRTALSNDAIWRYERRASAIPLTANQADGEMQLFLHANLADGVHNTSPFVAFGSTHSWFQTSLRVRPYYYATAGNSIEVWPPTTSIACFAVAQDGNLAIIHQVPYVWPLDHPPAGAQPAAAGAKFLRCDVSGNLEWETPVSGSTITGLTNYRVPRWSTSAAPPALVDSAITDTTSVDGTVSTACLTFALARTGSLDLSPDVYLRTGISNDAIWRYEHRTAAAGGCRLADNNPDGEMQLFLHANLDTVHGQNPFVAFGSVHSWFQTTLRVRPYFYSTAGNSIEVWPPTTSIACFAVAQDGNLAIIRQVGYSWPLDRPPSVAAPAAAGAKFLRCDTSGNLAWESPTATGGGNVSSTAGGTHLRMPRWDGTPGPPYTSPTFKLVDSAIEDRTGPGGNGTVQIDCVQLMFKRVNDGNDISDFYMRSFAGNNAAIRYENRAWTGGPPNPGVEDSANTSGELQVALGAVAAGAVPAVVMGSHHSWFKGGVRIKPTSANTSTVNSAFEVAPYNSSTPNFAITQAGDLSIIKGVNYQWPGLFTTAPVRYLQASYFSGTLMLNWVELTTGGMGGSGTVSTLPVFTGTTPSSTLGNSQVTQDAAKVYVNSRDLQITGDPAVADLAQLWLVGNAAGPPYGVWRYEHRGVGLYDPANTGGEIQARINADVTHIAFGAKRSYFNNVGLRVRMGDTTDYPFAVCSIGGALNNFIFRIDTDGGLGIIRSVNYTWPSGPLTYPVGGAYKFLGFNTTAGTPQLGWFDAPASTGGGANTALSNLTTTAVNLSINPDVAQNGLLQLGDNNAVGGPRLWNVMHCKSGVFVFPSGSTESSPRAFGFIPSATAFSTSEATRFLIYGDRNCIQSGDHCRTQLASYSGIELQANRQVSTAPTFNRLLFATSEDTAVQISSGANAVGLLITLPSGNTREILRGDVGGSTWFKVTAAGDIMAHGVQMLWPAAVAAVNGYVLSMSDRTTGQLQWIPPPAGGSGVTWNSGSGGPITNALTKWTPGAAPYTIQNSNVVDSGVQVNINSPMAVVISGTNKFKVSNQGSIDAEGGTQFKAKELQTPVGSPGFTFAISTDWRTVIVDTWYGWANVTLPSAQANPGMILDIIHMRAVQSILTPIQTGYDQVINVQTTGIDVFNGWGGGQPQATVFKLSYPGFNGIGTGTPPADNQHKMIRLIADESLAIWWLMPYYL